MINNASGDPLGERSAILASLDHDRDHHNLAFCRRKSDQRWIHRWPSRAVVRERQPWRAAYERLGQKVSTIENPTVSIADNWNCGHCHGFCDALPRLELVAKLFDLSELPRVLQCKFQRYGYFRHNLQACRQSATCRRLVHEEHCCRCMSLRVDVWSQFLVFRLRPKVCQSDWAASHFQIASDPIRGNQRRITMTITVPAANAPLRNACLRIRNCLSKGNTQTDLMRRYGINLVLDVGANEGQYARTLKKNGYTGRIISFEPLPDAFANLAKNRWGFSSWRAEPFALGATDTVAVLHVSGNSVSSSLQPMHSNHSSAAPESEYVGDCQVEIRRLDSVFDQYYRPGDRCYLKIDVQGHEHLVIEGASRCLESISVVEAELSMVTLYEGQMLWQETIELMQSLGFELAMLTPGFCDPRTGIMLQADGIFVRHSEADKLRATA